MSNGTTIAPVSVLVDVAVALIGQAPELIKSLQAILASGGSIEEQAAAIADLKAGKQVDLDRVAKAAERDV